MWHLSLLRPFGASYVPERLPADGPHAPRTVLRVEVSASYFGTTGVRLVSGRAFTPDEPSTGRRQVRASCWIRVSQPWGKIGQFNAVLEITTGATGVTDGTSNTFMIGEKVPRPLNGTVETILARGSTSDMLVGIAPGQSLRMSAFDIDDSRTDTVNGQSLRMQVNVYDENGTVVVTSREVEIASGHFGSIDVDRRDLLMSGEPGTGRARVRVKPLFAFPPVWNGRVVTSLEIVDSAGNTTSGPECLVFFLGGIPGR